MEDEKKRIFALVERMKPCFLSLDIGFGIERVKTIRNHMNLFIIFDCVRVRAEQINK